MKTKYRFIHFEREDELPLEKMNKRSSWSCRNNRTGHILGDVFVYESWGAYCFFPVRNASIALSSDCLRDIADFLEQLNKERKR